MTGEQAALLKKARESIRASRLLVEHELFDFAASRAYYAMFYVAQAMLFGRGLSFSKHSAVIAAFGQQFVKGGQVNAEFHRYLIAAQESRNSGDYDIKADITKEQAELHIKRAEAFVEMGEQHFKSDDEAQTPIPES